MSYIQRTCTHLSPDQPRLRQAVETAFSCFPKLPEIHPEYEKNAVLERLSRPELFSGFDVVWMDDRSRVQISRGYFAAYFPTGGLPAGLYFRSGLTADEMEALAFYAMLEKSLCRPGEGSAVCGADCDPALLSDGECMRFCQSFVNALYRWSLPLGPFLPLSPGVTDRELGYLSGRQQMLGKRFEPMPPLSGAAEQKRAGGYGLCYFAQEAMSQSRRGRLDGKTVAVYGGGAIAAFAGEKAARMGGRVISIEDPAEAACPSADVYFLCSRERPVDGDAAAKLLSHGPDGVFEGVSMACTAEGAAAILQSGVLFSPGIASGAGAAAPAGRSHPLTWQSERALRAAMADICRTAWEKGGGDLFRGAHIAALENAAQTLIRRGV